MEFLGTPTPFAPAGDDTVVVYHGATLLDGHGGPPRPGTTIVTRGQRIGWVGPDAQAEPGHERVDLTGSHVIPGLIDTHQHLATPPDRAVAELVLRRHVLGGVTAVRDMADDLRQITDLARATLVGEIPGPDIRFAALMAGPGFFDDPRTWQVSRGATPGAVPWMQAITTETDLPLAVARAKGTGATAIKIYADLPAGLVTAVTVEAHRQGLHVWAHGTVFPARPTELIEAGVDVLSHVTLLAHQACADLSGASYRDKPPIDFARFAAADDPVMAGVFAAMRARGTVLDATATLWTHLAVDDAMAELAVALTRQAHAAGVEICTGTDYETPADHDVPALIEEMIFLVEKCGIPAAEVIRSATLVGARSMAAEDEMGTVEAGKLANFAVVDGDPAADITRLRRIRLTVKRGRRHAKDSQ